MIDWNLAPEGANEIKMTNRGKMYFSNSEGFYYHGAWKPLPYTAWKTIATRPTQTKTVADAVEQEGEKWTHTYSDYGVYKDCIIIHDKPDDYGMILVMNRRGEYVLTDDLKEKPIKPTLTKSKAWDILTAKSGEYHHTFNPWETLLERYEVV